MELDLEKYNHEEVEKTKAEAGWTRQTQIMEMSKEEWAAAQLGEIGDDSDSDSDWL